MADKRMAKVGKVKRGVLGFSLRLSPEVHLALVNIAAEIGYGVTVTAVIHQAIQEFIERRGQHAAK